MISINIEYVLTDDNIMQNFFCQQNNNTKWQSVLLMQANILSNKVACLGMIFPNFCGITAMKIIVGREL